MTRGSDELGMLSGARRPTKQTVALVQAARRSRSSPPSRTRRVRHDLGTSIRAPMLSEFRVITCGPGRLSHDDLCCSLGPRRSGRYSAA